MASMQDESSDSDDSDDEFLTIGEGKDSTDGVDREAMIRRKLMENFYGKMAVPESSNETEEPTREEHAAAAAVGGNDNATAAMATTSSSTQPGTTARLLAQSGQSSLPFDTNQRADGSSVVVDVPTGSAAEVDDLDSPYFDAEKRTNRLVLGSSVHTLLETEERLALQVRTLDSTMQTLVYENYSKFIDATDAIKSIGVSVNANEEGLSRLSSGIQTIDKQTRSVEDALGGLRDAVAEKLRVKRLLTRLDALLKLPTTLHQQIASGKYRLAAKSYLSASSILSKHSAGFESLKNIEIECQNILTEMVQDLKRKLLHWSGQKNRLGAANTDDTDMVIEFGEEGGGGGADDGELGGDDDVDDDDRIRDETWLEPPKPPQNITEIFECAGTLFMLVPNENDDTNDNVLVDGPVTSFDSGLTAEECKAMSLDSAVRLLDRILDTHLMDLQERKFTAEVQKHQSEQPPFDTNLPGSNMTSATNAGDMATEVATAVGGGGGALPGSHLIPNSFLDSVLEAATLYGLSFAGGRGSVKVGSNSGFASKDDSTRLVDFVTKSFATFLGHVRNVLLDQSLQNDPAAGDDDDGLDDSSDERRGNEEDDGDDIHAEISGAMTHLLRSVRDLASGLALPEVGIDVEVASTLVDETVEVTEAMVRRRVAQKFYGLRIRVLKDCLGPFVKNALALPEVSTIGSGDESTSTIRVIEIVQMASVAYSDSMQLVEDVVRSILDGGVVLGASATTVDFVMVKQAVQTSCRRFAVWLASTFEIISGCEVSDPRVMVEVPAFLREDDEDDKKNIASSTVLDYDMSDEFDQSERVETILQKILASSESIACDSAYSDLRLAIAEMCRLAEKSVMENIHHSIAASSTGKKSKSTGIFPSVGRFQNMADNDQTVMERFKLAGTRILGLYAINRGAEAATFACVGFNVMACAEGDEIPSGPRSAAWQILEVAKLTCIDCANVFGDDKRAGPVPSLWDDDQLGGVTSPLKFSSSVGLNHMSAMKGLQFDVERMFTEKVPSFPHPSRFMDFSRDAVVTIVFQVAFNAMVQYARTCYFTTMGYKQLQVDIELLRCLISHYVKEDFQIEGKANACTVLTNLLNDVMHNAGERCRDVDCVGQEKYYDAVNGFHHSPRSIIREFISPSDKAEKGEDITLRFIIDEY